MTTLYLVSNNCVLNNLNYKLEESLELKRVKRPLSIDGENKAKELANIEELQELNVIYSSGYASAIATAKYIAENLELNININNKLNERKIGLLENKTLRFFKEHQEHDFDYRLNGGESINGVKNRITTVINNILKENKNNNLLIVTHNTTIMSYLLNFCEKGFNLDDRLILNFQNEVIMDGTTSGMEIFKLEFEDDELLAISKL